MKSSLNIRPRYIIAITAAVAVLMFGSAFFELRQSRNELLGLLQEHSLSLAETVERSSANLVLSTEQIENQLTERLFNNAFYIARLDSEGKLTQHELRRFCEVNNIFRINIIDRRGNRILGSHEQIPEHTALKEKNNPRETLRPILDGETDRLIIGLKQARFEDGQRYAVAVKRTRPGGGAIVLNLDAAKLVEFRKRIGIGRLLNDISDNAGIDYVVLQDREGVLAATNRVKEISRIEQDPFLGLALESDSTIIREIEFNGLETFEVVKRLVIEGSTVGVLRIGLSMDELRSSEERMTRRLLIMAIVLIAIGALVFTAIIVNQNYRLVSQKYADIQSFTGNILKNMQDAVVTIDSQQHVTIVNRKAEELFAISANDITGKRLDELSHYSGQCLSRIFLSTEQELTLECIPGKTRIVSISLSRTKKDDGSVESQTAVIKDLTEARRLEGEMHRKEKLMAMGELASGVAHEVRNPLNAISMIAQRYEKEFTPRSGVKEYRSLTEVLKKESARVNGIIQHFLSFARPPKLKLTDVSVRQFVNHVSTLFQSQAKAGTIEFDFHCRYEGTIRMDHNLMTQAVLNLLQNALDATPQHGSIALKVFKKGQLLIIEVQDTGAGIPKEQLEKIFNLYFTTKARGNGMGLALTQQIVSQHQGSITVQSEPSKGSTFTISLPLS